MKKKHETLGLEKALLKLEKLCASIDFIQVRIASPERIKSWATRIVGNQQFTGNLYYKGSASKMLTTEFGSLFCQRIFGPIKDKVCACLNNQGNILNKVCPNCEVELIEARVRRYRMGCIELINPINHIWYLQGKPSYLINILQCFKFSDKKLFWLEKKKNFFTFKNIKRFIYFTEPISSIIDEKHPLYKFYTNLSPVFSFKKTLKTNEYFDYPIQEVSYPNKIYYEIKKKKPNSVKVITPFFEPSGAEIIKAALESLDLNFEINKARNRAMNRIAENKISIEKPSKESSFFLPKLKKLLQSIRILESFKSTNAKLGWIILTILPILPPALRPIYETEKGAMITSDINEIYILILSNIDKLLFAANRNTTGNIGDIYAFRITMQELVDCLINNAKSFNRVEIIKDKPLIGFTEMLETKYGRFRYNILGKRVDYSGRAVIVAEPSLRINECGLPLSMALELFEPFLINKILKSVTDKEKIARYIFNKKKPYVWVLIKELMQKHCIMLNRAPTLHKHGIQAFKPFLTLDNAIHLHPLVCTGFNADFDGDQMAVHLPIYNSSQIESSFFMKPSSNSILQSNGNLVLKPTQDIVIGNYYLTLMLKNNNFISLNSFASEEKALEAYIKKLINLHSRILIRYSISKILFKVSSNNLSLLDNDNELTDMQSIKFYKIFKSNINYYIITNFGILIARKRKELYYLITDFFLETTVGRIIFSQNLKYLLLK